MSNIVKWNYVNFDKKDKLVIDSDHINKPKTVYGENSAEGIMKELHIKTPQEMVDDFKQKDENPGFQEGMNVINYDKMMEEEKKRIASEADSLISNAKEEAERLLQEAAEQAEAIKNDAYAQGKTEGYEAGLKEGQESIEAAKAKIREQEGELVREREKLEQVYLEKLKESESFFADMIGTLVEKITGVVTLDRKDIILYLLEKGISEAGQSDRFVLHVSAEDMETVEEQKEALISALKEGTGLEIIMSEQLGKNQCLIETESKIIETSLDVQLRTLMEDLRMMSIS